MDSFTPKPFIPGKPTAYKGFQARQSTEMAKTSQTLPVGMPGLSGDILKQKLATMGNRSSPEVIGKSSQKSLVKKKPEEGPLNRSSGSIKGKTGQAAIPMLTSKDIQNRRDSMHKAPPPPTPDSIKQKMDKTPEFLRKKLKPTGKVLASDEKEQENVPNDVEKPKENEIVEKKSDFRNSKLMFEQFSAVPPVAPKPRTRSTQSFKSVTNNVSLNKNDDSPNDGESMPNSAEEKQPCSNDYMDEKSFVESKEEAVDPKAPEESEFKTKPDEPAEPKEWPKPENISLPEVPAKLSEWIKKFVVHNKNLSRLADEENEENAKAPYLMQEDGNNTDSILAQETEEIYDDVESGRGSIESIIAQETEEIYDDVEDGRATNPPSAEQTRTVKIPEDQQIQGEIYDDVAIDTIPKEDSTVDESSSEEIYDDVNNPQTATEYTDLVDGSKAGEELYDDVDTSGAAGGEEVYDDVNEHPQAVTEEFYDDVTGDSGAANQEIYDDIAGDSQQVAQEIYDDIEMHPQPNLQSGEETFDEGAQGEGIYEPVETIAQYVTTGSANANSLSRSESSQSSQNNEKANKKKEEKERKEREKLEKKRKEEAEKKFKKEEEERKKREREERKRIEKERKSFNLKPEEDPLPIERHMTTCDFKGKNKDLPFSKGEYLDIITKNNCPKGKWLAQNSSGKLGYVQTSHLGIDKRKSLFDASSPVAVGVAFGDEFYEEVTSQSVFSAASMQSSNDCISSPTTLAHFKPAVNIAAQEASDEGGAGEDIYELVS